MFLNDSVNAMVVRWKVALMQFDFDIKHLAGVKNIVADLLSRLVENRMEDKVARETIQELRTTNPTVINKAVTEVILSLLLNHELLPDDIYLKIKRVYNAVVGHGGVERTMSLLARQGQAWKYMRTHVKSFIKQCACCQKMSVLKIDIQAHHFVTSSYSPMSLLNIDFIGPFNIDNETGYILTIICCFSRWVELYICNNITAKETANALLQHFGRFGAPSHIRSDQGSHFINEVIKEFLPLNTRLRPRTQNKKIL